MAEKAAAPSALSFVLMGIAFLFGIACGLVGLLLGGPLGLMFGAFVGGMVGVALAFLGALVIRWIRLIWRALVEDHRKGTAIYAQRCAERDAAEKRRLQAWAEWQQQQAWQQQRPPQS